MFEKIQLEKQQQLEKPQMKQNPGELFFLLILLAIITAFFVESAKLTGVVQGSFNGPGTIPQLITIVVIVLICLEGAKHLKNRERNSTKILHYLFSKQVIIMLTMVILYAFLLEILRFEITTFLFLFIVMYLFDRRKPLQKLIISLGTVGFIKIIFAYLLQVVLP